MMIWKMFMPETVPAPLVCTALGIVEGGGGSGDGVVDGGSEVGLGDLLHLEEECHGEIASGD